MADIKSKTELLKELSEKRKALQEFRFAIAGSKIKDVKKGKNIRKDIARLLTQLRAERK